ncbi:MAG: hypothetical protein ABIE03_02415 [Patescibacteria group bacterium]
MKRLLIILFLSFNLFIFVPQISEVQAQQTPSQYCSCPAGAVDNHDSTCTTAISDSVEAGTIAYGWSGFDEADYVRYISDPVSEVSFGYAWALHFDWLYRGYIQWDVTSIPESVEVTNIELVYEGLLDGPEVSHIQSLLTGQPNIISNQTLYDGIATSQDYVYPWTPVIDTNQTQDLGALAVSDIESQLSSGWFAIAFTSDNTGAGNFPGGSASIDYLQSNSPDPTLNVTYYQVCQTTSLSLLKSVSSSKVSAGESVNFIYLIENTGEVVLSEISLTDDVLGVIDCPKNTLNPGESMTCEQSSVINFTVTNTAIVQGLDPNEYTVSASSGDITVYVLQQLADTGMQIYLVVVISSITIIFIGAAKLLSFNK